MTSSSSSPVSSVQRPSSPWHSPLPYLFGGLAAMLGLMAFALLILACSFLKPSSSEFNENNNSNNNNNNNHLGDLESGNNNNNNFYDYKTESSKNPITKANVVVIMAGDFKPTFLATPISNKSGCLGDANENNCCDKGFEKKNDGEIELHKQVMNNHDRESSTTVIAENHQEIYSPEQNQ